MRKSFTLIELLITISLIVIMAVVAIPAFNNYSVRANTQAKAEEIKYFIENIYALAQSPTKGNNGAVFRFDGSNLDEITRYEEKFNDSCFKDINAVGCIITTPSTGMVNTANFTLTSEYNDGAGNNGINNIEIKLLSPADAGGIFICPSNGSKYVCDINNISMTLTVRPESGDVSYNVLVNRYPFKVTVTENGGGVGT